MSSILEALKKAEQESAADQGKGTPWPAPSMTRRDAGRRWLWIPIGLLAGGCLLGSVFWLTRAPDSDKRAAVGKRATEPIAAGKTIPAARLDGQPSSNTLPTVATAPDLEPSVRPPQQKTSSAVTPDASSSQPRPRLVPKPKKTPETGRQPKTPSVVTPAPVRQPLKMAQAPQPPENVPKEEQKVFRSDSRVDLQALVWAPESADRFVVVNNRLVKEGGTIDQITVVLINQDDVLLSEGADRWYQKFKIR